MSDDTPIQTDEVFLDTCVLMDYAKDEVDPSRKMKRREAAAKMLFKCLTELERVASKTVEEEFKDVTQRRADELEEAEEHAAENSLKSYDFTGNPDLSLRDERNLTQFRDTLLEKYDELEALRRLNKRHRRFVRKQEELFDDPDPKVTTRPLGYTVKVYTDLDSYMDNRNDREILSNAVEWHANGSGNVFVTSDEDDFTFDDPSRLYTFEERLNKIIQAHTEDGDQVHILATETFVTKQAEELASKPYPTS